MDNCYEKSLNVGVDPTHNSQIAAIVDFCFSMLHITYFRRHSLGGASVVDLVIGVRGCLRYCLFVYVANRIVSRRVFQLLQHASQM